MINFDSDEFQVWSISILIDFDSDQFQSWSIMILVDKTIILVFSHIPKFGQKLMFFSCLDEKYVVAGQEFYSCPVDDHLQGKNRILAQLPYNV